MELSPSESSQLAAGAGGLFSGLFSSLFDNPGKPYQAATNAYQPYLDKATSQLSPYSQAGMNAIPQYQSWLSTMQNPSGFINNLMGQYQESPWAKYQQQQSIRAAQNAASAGGGNSPYASLGSTPFAQQIQQNASNISSGDMNQWLQNVLGINTQFGSGTQGLINNGQQASNALANLYNGAGQFMGEQAYNEEAANQNNMWNTIAGGAQLLPFILGA